jgi:uncharacterized protein YgbK (DUF1537 family)
MLTNLDNVSKIGRQLTDVDKRILQGKIDKILKTGGAVSGYIIRR